MVAGPLGSEDRRICKMEASTLPRVSVVTPSFNQAKYLRATLESVLGQNYPNLEYFVLDGGSQDGSREIIVANQHRLAHWRSCPDRGQAAAINEGFSRATGDIFGWLNSDDLYCPGTLGAVAQLLGSEIKEPVVCYGGCELFWDKTNRREIRSAIPFDRVKLQIVDFLDQPSVFWTSPAWEKVGPLDEDLRYGFDWDWFLRASRACRFIQIDKLLSRYRIHKEHKSTTGGKDRWNELMKVVERHSTPEVLRHYEFLAGHPAAQWWLNKRMRVQQKLQALPFSLSNLFADLLSPPFWLLPKGIQRETLWLIAGIR
jgi:glycosyltransferase involved in cell wall biosynthesis